MYQIKMFNKISQNGLVFLTADKYQVATEMENEDGVLVRSGDMHNYPLHSNLKAIARAGAGTNNIPVDSCAEAGIVVFNTPGANANAVKELVLGGMILSSRNIVGGIEWVKDQAAQGTSDIPNVVEKGKSQFVGPEIMGKSLGVLGLGAIGVKVANMAVALGMKVYGYDPFLTEENRCALDPHVELCGATGQIYLACDYISVHVPQNSETKGMLNAEAFGQMKKGVRIINVARGGLVNNADMKVALENGTVSCYVTDFPDDETASMPGVIPIPHLGASSPESEENCAIMAAQQMRDYLELGNIRNSVNLPNLEQPWTGKARLCILHKNVPDFITISSKALSNLTIASESTATRGDYSYTIIDLSAPTKDGDLDELKKVPGILTLREITR